MKRRQEFELTRSGKESLMDRCEAEGRPDAAEWLEQGDLRATMRSEEASAEVGMPDTRQPMQVVNVRLPAALVDAVNTLAAERAGQNRSDLIREALTEYLARETGPIPAEDAEHALAVLQRVVRGASAA